MFVLHEKLQKSLMTDISIYYRFMGNILFPGIFLYIYIIAHLKLSYTAYLGA